MLRFRTLNQRSNHFELQSLFDPQNDETGFLLGERVGCLVVFDFLRKSSKISVHKLHNLDLPSLDLIQEEVNYMFNLFKSLSPYETSSHSPRSVSPDFSAVSD